MRTNQHVEYMNRKEIPSPLDMQPTKLLKYDKLRLLVERQDETGAYIPFDIRYCTKTGDVVESRNCICTGVNTRHKRHTYRMGGSGLPRTFRDVLVMQVNEYRIVAS